MVESRQCEVLIIVCTFTVVACFFVLLRLWSRLLGRNFGWDDYLIIAALVLLVGDTVGTWTYILLSGTGFHVYDLPQQSPHELLVALHWNFSAQMIYHPLMGIIRASIIMFLFRMKDNRRRIRYPLHAVFWCNIIYSFGSTLTNVLQCTPKAYAWNKPIMDSVGADGKVVLGGECIDTRTFVLTSCSLSIFMDLIIMPIPSIMVWKLQMGRRTKLLVVIVMSLGWIATGVSVGRFIVYYYRFAPTNTDRTWNIGIAISIAEPAIHIICACAPATKRLFRELFPQYRTEQDASYYEDRTKSTARVSRGSRTLDTFNFGPLNGEENAAGLELEGGAPRTAPLSIKSRVSEYDLKAMESFESRDVREQAQRKMSCSKTACTETSEPAEAEPRHCLGQAR